MHLVHWEMSRSASLTTYTSSLRKRSDFTDPRIAAAATEQNTASKVQVVRAELRKTNRSSNENDPSGIQGRAFLWVS